MKRISLLLSALVVFACFTSCTKKAPSTSPSGPAMSKITGTITYVQKSALPPDALVEVQLLDVSRQDVAGDVVGEQTIVSPGQVPIRFSVEYDPAKIIPDHTYAIQARILSGGKLLFVNSTKYNVITNGNPTKVEVIVEPAS
jgi:putative lipoprotein